MLEEAASADDVICLAGDIGTGGSGEVQVALALQKAGCTQVRLLGDLVYPKGIRDASDENLPSHLLQPYGALLDAGVPVYLALGNHDYDGNPAAWLEVAKGNHGLHMPARFYAEQQADGLCIITLDTNWYQKINLWPWRSTQTDWLRTTLERLKGSCTLSVGLGHHPLYASGDHGNARFDTGIFLQEEVTGKFDVYIAGHEHLLGDEGEVDGTRWLVSGAGAKNGGATHPNARAEYLSDQLGFLILRPVREDGRIRRAVYEFWEVPWTGDGPARLAHTGVIEGAGIRL